MKTIISTCFTTCPERKMRKTNKALRFANICQNSESTSQLSCSCISSKLHHDRITSTPKTSRFYMPNNSFPNVTTTMEEWNHYGHPKRNKIPLRGNRLPLVKDVQIQKHNYLLVRRIDQGETRTIRKKKILSTVHFTVIVKFTAR